MKKITAVLLTLVLVFSFAACSNQANNSKTNETKTNNTPESSSSENAEPSTASLGKTLVVYYSASGNTKSAAEYIAKATNGDMFELEPKNAYSDADLDWTDKESRVNYEHDNENARDIELVAATIDRWEEYDTVFIGYPIWWGIAAWPVNAFVKGNDFTGKNVIPFCTSASSGLGESGKLLEDMVGTGNWIDGERFSSGVSESDVIQWVENIKL